MSCSELSRTYCILASRHCFHNGPMSCCSVIHSLYRREHRKTWSLKRRWSLVNPNSRKVKAAKDHLRGRRKGCGHMGSGRQSQMQLMMPMLLSLPGMFLSCLEAQDELYVHMPTCPSDQELPCMLRGSPTELIHSLVQCTVYLDLHC